MKFDGSIFLRNRNQAGKIRRGCRQAVLLAFSLLALLIGDSCTQQPFKPEDSIETFSDYLDKRIPRLMQRYAVPGMSIALVRGGELVWSGAYGYADLEQNRRMTVDAICRVESISKSVTAWGVIKLVEQGLVELDAPLQQYLGDWKLPESEYSEQNITVRRLLSQNAGLSLGTIGMEYPPESTMPSLRETMTQETRLFREPGAGFSYSNTGFNLLELLIETVTGREFADYMADEVLAPLGMYNSGFRWNEVTNSTIPTGYDLRGKPVPVYVYPVKASGGLFAPVEDIARFVMAGMTGACCKNRAVLGQESIRLLHTPQVDIPGIFGVVADSYGFGHFIENLPNGGRAVWHGGQGHGWMTHFHSVPESGDGIVILTNSQRSWPVMARVLSDWAQWSGFESVKMGRITYGIVALWVLIGIVILIVLWQAYRLVRELRSGKRRLAPLARDHRKTRLLQAAQGTGVIAVLAWSVAQPYLIVSSIFPGVAGKAGIAFFVWAIILVMSALLPQVENQTKQNR